MRVSQEEEDGIRGEDSGAGVTCVPWTEGQGSGDETHVVDIYLHDSISC